MTYEFIPQFAKMLENLSRILDKAQAYADTKKFDAKVLLQTRLAPDQFDFTRQVQITCDTAKFYASRLAGKTAPAQEDKETTIAELKERIRSTVEYLHTFKASDLEGWQDRKILNPRREGKYLTGEDYAMHQAIPNFYFHMTTAYSILRNNGIDVGKMDFLGALNYRAL
jgi:hypothetical protein